VFRPFDTETPYAALVAAAVGVEPGSVSVISGDSDSTDTGSSNASRSLCITGNAVCEAAGHLRDRVRTAVAKMLDIDLDDVTITPDGVVAGNDLVTLAQVGGYAGAISVEGSFHPTADVEAPRPGLLHYGYAVGAVEVTLDVDEYTGSVVLRSIRAVADPGRMVDPAAVRSQIEGAMAQGVGYALFEDAPYEESIPTRTRLATYIIPTATDLPHSIAVVLLETPTTTNPLGARGIAELGLAPMAPAIANAIADAIGQRFNRFPITAEDILGSSQRAPTHDRRRKGFAPRLPA